MAVSGSQKTRIGGYLSGVGKRQDFSAKVFSDPWTAVDTSQTPSYSAVDTSQTSSWVDVDTSQ